MTIMQPTPLCYIMGKYGSDKGHEYIQYSWHNYTLVYHKLFQDIQHSTKRVFELGIGTNNVAIPSNMGKNGTPGASLYGWAEFFPNAQIFGADIDRDILFQTERIHTYYCDQTNPDSIQTMWSQAGLEEPFDIMIEDGLHTFEANVCFFENSIHKLKKGGYYMIEDIRMETIEQWKNQLEQWKEKYAQYTYKLLTIPSQRNYIDNTLLIIQYV
jgi:hypothetical protein